MGVREIALRFTGVVLFIQFYIIWALGFMDYAPQLYNYGLLRISAILLTIGLLLALNRYLISMIRDAIVDKYFRALILIYAAATYYITYNATLPYYQLNLDVSLDTATYMQSFASATLYHRFFSNFVAYTFFFNHSSPILFLIYPLYLTYPGIATLTAIQVILATLPTIPLYKLGQKLFNDRKYALATAIIYLAYPWTTTYLTGPFEVVILTAPFLALTLYNLYMGNKWGYWISLTLMMMTIEFSPIIGIFLALYISAIKLDWLKTKQRIALSTETLAYSIAWLITAFLMVYYFSHGTINIFQNLWGSALAGPLIGMSNTIAKALFHLASQTKTNNTIDPQTPIIITNVAVTLMNNVMTGFNTKVQTVVLLMAPLLFLNLAEPQNLLLLPWLYAALQTTFPPYYIVWVYYTALVAPAIVLPAIWALRRFNMNVRKRVFIAILIATMISFLFLNSLSPLSSIYFNDAIPNPLKPATTPYNLALIQLNNHIPPNTPVATPATAVPWYSLTRYGWGKHGVPFFGPNSYTQYVVYSPLISTEYPYNPDLGQFEPYIFNDGAWLLAKNYNGSVIRLHSFNYTITITIQPITPGTYQYTIALIPNGPTTVKLNIQYTPIETIQYATEELPQITQQPQGIECAFYPPYKMSPNYFILLNSNQYLIQPIILNSTITIETITIFGSGTTTLNGEVALSTAPILTQTNTIWTTQFPIPWWCLPHSWATPITVNPGIALRPGTYYMVVQAPTEWQALCTYIPNTPKAMLYNGEELQQLNCTLNTIITTNKPTETTNINTEIAITLLNNTITINTQRETQTTITYETNLISKMNWETLSISTNQTIPARLTITVNTYVPGQYPPITTPWYLTPAYGNTPTYTLLILAVIPLLRRNKKKNEYAKNV